MKNFEDSIHTSKQLIGGMIQNRRKNNKMSQQDLATLLQVDRQYIWRIENGKVNLTMNYLDKIIKELNCLHSDFFITIII